MALYRNNTGGASKVGYVVKVDPRDVFAFVYALPDETNILGIVTRSVPRFDQCEIATTGSAKVFISERVVIGNTIRTQKTSDNISRGTCKMAKTTDIPYMRVGTALESGKGLIACNLSFSYLFSASDAIEVNNINFNVRTVTDTTTELITDYTIVCNKATIMTVNLLPATGSGRIIQIANINTGEVTVSGDGADTINGELTQPVYQDNCINIQDYASGKFIIV